MHGLPIWLGVFLVGAIFAKIISTANNYLFSPATNLVNDVFVRYIEPEASNKRILIVSRLMVVLLGPVGALPVAPYRVRASKISLRLHHLLRRAHARNPCRLFLETHYRSSCRHLHRRRNPGDRNLGFSLHPHSPAGHSYRSRCHLSCPAHLTFVSCLRQSRYPRVRRRPSWRPSPKADIYLKMSEDVYTSSSSSLHPTIAIDL